MTNERTSSELSQAAETLKEILTERGISASVGKRALQSADIGLVVNLKSDEKKAEVPSNVDGFPVHTKVTGKYTAQ